ncbi:calmodulin-binding protein 60 G-like isoform X1 [Benincasa hispida]|uniref:calmodulin-binding protein 60 G-like isoform X1 n=1 Tax=Benincasa hispida TaxID=102211 RepID=UPI001901FFEE|nr:calmodulin-binding protein 60 G-like isoform X1 [Benincasa hispida]XP_038880653.1 calmodulin-binding protein 60 G-like isoform X1 [Benincasa hispida]XP_038880654.1 calmodulin-binding protein 60 G-like isoform X1 [Benincasa hispida]
MENKGVGSSNSNKKMKISPYSDENPNPNSLPPSLPTRFEGGSVAEDQGYNVELMCGIMKPLLRKLVQVEVENAIQTHFPTPLQTLRKEIGEEEIKEDGIEKFKLVFWNEPASIIFTNNEINAENGEPLKVAIFYATTNAIVSTGLLSSARLQFFLLDGDHDCSPGQQQHHPLYPRDGKRPLIVGDDLNLILKNGVASVHSLSITDNSSWIKSKKFRLGVEIKDDKILAMFSHIRVAVSQPLES